MNEIEAVIWLKRVMPYEASIQATEVNNLSIKALKKQIPQRPIETQELMDIEWLCPVCGFQVSNSFGIDNYCGGCGQRIG